MEYFISLGTEEDEPIYSYNDKYIKWFVRQSVKRGRVSSSKQYCKSKICDDILKIIPEELNVKGNIYDIVELYFNYKNNSLNYSEKNMDINLKIIEMLICNKKKNISMKN